MQYQLGRARDLQPDTTMQYSGKSVPLMLAALVYVFILSHAFRTVTGIAVEPLAARRVRAEADRSCCFCYGIDRRRYLCICA